MPLPPSDPFSPLATCAGDGAGEFDRLQQRAVASASAGPDMAAPLGLMPVVARLHGFDIDDRPLLADLPGSPGEWVTARTTVPLSQAQRGQQALVVFENGDVRRPIVIGVLQQPQQPALHSEPAEGVRPVVWVDGESQLIEAEREIVLRCGEASITLTRAGKVIIQGNYILSRSRGYNKIKGAAIDIN
ncbi:MAG: DUF6484 domain-containing protein [Acidobacteriota bacterium]